MQNRIPILIGLLGLLLLPYCSSKIPKEIREIDQSERSLKKDDDHKDDKDDEEDDDEKKAGERCRENSECGDGCCNLNYECNGLDIDEDCADDFDTTGLIVGIILALAVIVAGFVASYQWAKRIRDNELDGEQPRLG